MFNIKDQIKGNVDFDLKITQDHLNEIKRQLKKEFIGIDYQIDSIVESIKPWLFFKDSLSKPIIINLWGMTGCGKTQVVDRLLELLKIKTYSYRLNGSELNENYPLSTLINGHANINKSPIVVFDEFQNYKCKDKRGNEYEKYNSTLWDFIDTGLVKNNDYYYSPSSDPFGLYAVDRIIEALLYFDNNTFNKLHFTFSDKEMDVINMKGNNVDKTDTQRALRDMGFEPEEEEHEVMGSNSNKPVSYGSKLAKKGDLSEIIYIHPSVMTDLDKWCVKENNVYTFQKNFYKGLHILLNMFSIDCGDNIENDLSELSIGEFSELIVRLMGFVGSNKNPIMDYSKSIIFVIGNVDEAFGVHDNMNPDMSADEFHKITKKVNIVHIKEALFERFRPEHIARLGNTHIIYPSLNSKSYREIITKQLNDYSELILQNNNIVLKFDSKLHKVLYKESVFPTLGVRNVTSTINDMIKSNFSNSLMYALEKEIEYDTILYKYKNKHIFVEFIKDNKIVGTTSHKITFRVDNLRENKKNDQQALTAIHESGHAILQILLQNKLPLEIYSVTADTESNGFTWAGVEEINILNKKKISEMVKILLAGRAAEIIVFGDEQVTTGASSDLKKANGYLFAAYRGWGMRSYLVKSSITPNDNDVALEYKDEITKKVDAELKLEMEQTVNLLKRYKRLLLKLGEYLSTHPRINKETLIKIIKENSDIDIDKLNDKQNYGYKNKLLKELSLIDNIITNNEEKDNLYD